MASSRVIMPRSPWLASLGCTKKAGVPVEAKVAAIFWAMWPLLPMPVTITRPLAAASVSTAARNGCFMPASSTARKALSPSHSRSSVRTADCAASAADGLPPCTSRSFLLAPAAIDPPSSNSPVPL